MDYRHGAGLALLLALCACATPTTQAPQITQAAVNEEAQHQAAYVLRVRAAEADRVARVAARLAIANVEVCPAKASRVGFAVAGLDGVKAVARDAAREGLNLTEQPQVLAVFPGSPADAAGLKPGDLLLRVDAHKVTPGDHATAQARAALTRADNAGLAFPVEVSHDGVRRTVSMTPQAVCDYPVEIDESDVINAYADGRRIKITRGMLKLVSTDDELAVVLGHEMAHDTEGHVSAKRRNAMAGAAGGFALDVLAAAAGVNTQGAFTKAAMQSGGEYASPAFEAEADYVGLYYTARAGFDISHAEDFWRKMSVEAPRAIAVTTSHPPNAQRYLALAAARKEIEAKRGAQLALLPDRAKAKASPARPEAGPAMALVAATSEKTAPAPTSAVAPASAPAPTPAVATEPAPALVPPAAGAGATPSA